MAEMVPSMVPSPIRRFVPRPASRTGGSDAVQERYRELYAAKRYEGWPDPPSADALLSIAIPAGEHTALSGDYIYERAEALLGEGSDSHEKLEAEPSDHESGSSSGVSGSGGVAASMLDACVAVLTGPSMLARADFRLDIGLMSNLVMLVITLAGLLLRSRCSADAACSWWFQQLGSLTLSSGLFGLSGGVTNSLAIHMLFEPVCNLPGTGVIPRNFIEIRLVIKQTIMRVRGSVSIL